MFLIQYIVIAQAVIFSFLGSILFGKPNLLSFVKLKDTGTSTATTTNNCVTTCGTCTGLTTFTGILRPPEYPDFSTQNYNCLFTVTVTSGKTITMYLPFNVIPVGDSLSIYDGASVGSVFVASFENTNAASTFSFTTSSNSLTVEMKTNAINGGGLWSINYVVQ